MSINTLTLTPWQRPGKWTNAVIIGNGQSGAWQKLYKLDEMNIRSAQFCTEKKVDGGLDPKINVVRVGELEAMINLHRDHFNNPKPQAFTTRKLPLLNVYASDVLGAVAKSTTIMGSSQCARVADVAVPYGVKNIFLLSKIEDLPAGLKDHVDFILFEQEAMNGTDIIAVDCYGESFKWKL